jgi:hypothetical protein
VTAATRPLRSGQEMSKVADCDCGFSDTILAFIVGEM